MGELFDAAKEVLKVSIDQKQHDFMERIYEALKQGKKHLEIQMGDCSEAYVKMFVKWLSDEGFSATHGSESPRPPMILFRLCVNLEPFYNQAKQPQDAPIQGNSLESFYEAEREVMAEDETPDHAYAGEWDLIRENNCIFKFSEDGTFRLIGAANAERIRIKTYDPRDPGDPIQFVPGRDYRCNRDGNDFIVFRPSCSTIPEGCELIALIVEPEA